MFNSLKRKKFDDSDDDKNSIDDDDDDDIFNDKKKKKTNSNKVIIREKIFSAKKSNKTNSKNSNIINDDNDDSDIINDSKSNSPFLKNDNNIEKEAEEEVKRQLKSFQMETIDITEPINITNNSNGNNTNKKTEELDKILNDLKTKKNQVKTIPKNQVFNLIEEDYKVAELIVPEIRKASERKITSNLPVTIDLLDSLLGIQTATTTATTTTATTNNNNNNNSNIEYIKLKTRLNGMHEHKWKLPKNDTFSKLISKFAEVYHLDKAIITLKFDGDKLQGTQTPDDKDMDDDDMIDVKIPNELCQKAIEYITNPPAPKPQTSSSSSSTNQTTDNSSSSSMIKQQNEKVVLNLQCADDAAANKDNSTLKVTLFSSFTLDHIHNQLLTFFIPGIDIEYYTENGSVALSRNIPLCNLNIIHDKEVKLLARKKIIILSKSSSSSSSSSSTTTATTTTTTTTANTIAMNDSANIQIELVLVGLSRKDDGSSTFQVTVKRNQNLKKMVKLVLSLIKNNPKENELLFKYNNKILSNFDTTYKDEGISENSKIIITKK